MKLLATTNRYYLALVLALFALSLGGLHFGLQRVLRDEADEQLLQRREYLAGRIRASGALPAVTDPHELSISSRPQPGGLRDTLLYDPVEAAAVPFRAVAFAAEVGGRHYWLTLRRSLVETSDLAEVALAVALAVLALLLGSLLLLNRWLSGWLWRPFRHTLAALRGYELAQPQALALPATPIAEFSELNHALTQLTERLAADYRALREFTENAAHETQTPLAIMQAQLEQLMQVPALAPAAVPLVQALYRATLRLSRLHQALGLLSRIENQAPPPTQTLRLDELVADKLTQLEDFTAAKGIRPSLLVLAPLSVLLPPALADSLVSNLLHNAIKHNVPGGALQVTVLATALEISNPGPALTVDPAELLGRFRKHNAASDSPGLGLAIAEQICRRYGLRLGYTYAAAGHWHTLRVEV